MSKHEWRENMEDGDVRLVTARREKGRWNMRARLKSDEDWTQFEEMPLDDLEYLREVLWNKYQRRRVPYEHILEIEKLIEAAQKKKRR